jgi:hypothetical protein
MISVVFHPTCLCSKVVQYADTAVQPSSRRVQYDRRDVGTSSTSTTSTTTGSSSN